jgi:hypothetical protein
VNSPKKPVASPTRTPGVMRIDQRWCWVLLGHQASPWRSRVGRQQLAPHAAPRGLGLDDVDRLDQGAIEAALDLVLLGEAERLGREGLIFVVEAEDQPLVPPGLEVLANAGLGAEAHALALDVAAGEQTEPVVGAVVDLVLLLAASSASSPPSFSFSSFSASVWAPPRIVEEGRGLWAQIAAIFAPRDVDRGRRAAGDRRRRRGLGEDRQRGEHEARCPAHEAGRHERRRPHRDQHPPTAA